MYAPSGKRSTAIQQQTALTPSSTSTTAHQLLSAQLLNNRIQQPNQQLNKNQKRNLKKSIAKQSSNNVLLLNQLESSLNLKSTNDIEDNHSIQDKFDISPIDERKATLILKDNHSVSQDSQIMPDSSILVHTKESAHKYMKKIQKKLRQVEELKREKQNLNLLLPEQEEKILLAGKLEEEMRELELLFGKVIV